MFTPKRYGYNRLRTFALADNRIFLNSGKFDKRKFPAKVQTLMFSSAQAYEVD